MTLEEIWRAKTDEEVMRASRQLGDYQGVGQQVILAELRRRETQGLVTASGTEANVPPLPRFEADVETQHAGLMRRLWHGQVPLARTYWRWGWGGRLVSYLLLFIAVASGSDPAAYAVMAVGELYFIFITVATWRSAGRYTGKRIWAELARVSIAAGLAISVIRMLFG